MFDTLTFRYPMPGGVHESVYAGRARTSPHPVPDVGSRRHAEKAEGISRVPQEIIPSCSPRAVDISSEYAVSSRPPMVFSSPSKSRKSARQWRRHYIWWRSLLAGTPHVDYPQKLWVKTGYLDRISCTSTQTLIRRLKRRF